METPHWGHGDRMLGLVNVWENINEFIGQFPSSIVFSRVVFIALLAK